MPFDYLPESGCVPQANAVDPGAAHRYRLVVHAQQNMVILRIGDQPLEAGCLLFAEFARVASGNMRVEEDQ